MATWMTHALPVMRNAMAGSASPRALGWLHFATTTVPGLALLPPANLALVSDVMPAVSGWRRRDVLSRVRAAYGVPAPSVVLGSICSSMPHPWGETVDGASDRSCS